MVLSRQVLSFAGAGVIALFAFGSGCSSQPPGFNPSAPLDDASVDQTSNGGDADIDGNAPPSFDEGGLGSCKGLECQRPQCDGGDTTLSGTVYDPAGANPLYNVIVYVPNAPLDEFPSGASCDQCGVIASGSPITAALTDAKGQFTLKNMPAGKDIPVVVQVGKWRRKVTIPKVDPCKETKIHDPQLLRLPRNHVEGDMPQIALTTGGCDALECLFHSIGVDDTEFTNGSGTGKVHVYTGDGGEVIDGSTDVQSFWGNPATLAKYDMVLLACECDETPSNKQNAVQAMHDYANSGGRVFASHYQYYWLNHGPADFQSTATFTPDGSSGSARPLLIDTSFPKGKAFADWLINLKASTTYGEIDILNIKGDVAAIDPQLTQQWIYVPAPDPSAKYMSFNTPVGKPPEQQCGRFVFTDLHVSGAGGSNFPIGCGDVGHLTPQEMALEFLLFDLSACVQDPQKPPPPPPLR